MKKYYVYQHIREDKMEVFYVGIGTRTRQDLRCNTYGRAYARHVDNSIWMKIIKKTRIGIQILFEFNTRKEAQDKEVELIAKYGRKFNNTGILANFTLGGEFNKGYKHSEETKRKISEKARRKRGYSNVVYTKELRQKMSKIQTELANTPERLEYRRQLAIGNTYHLGKKHSEESKQKMRESALNRKTMNAKTIKCKLTDFYNNKEWEANSIAELARTCPLSLSTLSRMSQGLKVSRYTSSQYKFYKNEA